MSMYCLHGLFHFSYSKLSSNSLYLFDCSLKEFTVVFNENSKFFIKTEYIRTIRIHIEKNYLGLCADHVISTGRQVTNLVSNFEYLLLLSFLTAAEF